MNNLHERSAVIVDAHPLWLDALAQLLDGVGMSVVARSTDHDDMPGLVREHEPDLIVLGLEAGNVDPKILTDIQELKSSRPDVKVIVFSPFRDHDGIEASFAVGVSAYCMKSAAPDDLMAAIRQSFTNSIYLATPRAASAGAPKRWDPDEVKPGLTKRELEMLRLVAEGHSNAQLGRMLWVTEQTVKFHLSNIYRKLNVANRTEASRWAQVHGLLHSSELTANTAA